jgi:hypothetical protein
MFFGLRTDMDKIARVLGLLASGVGVNAVCRQNDVKSDSLRNRFKTPDGQKTPSFGSIL